MPVLYWPPLSKSSCTELEGILGFPLPEGYKAFLCEWNGLFVSSPDWVNLPFPNVSNSEIAFSFLFGFRVPNKNQDIVILTSELKDELAHLGDIVVIGEDGGDNFFILVPSPASCKVFYWDRTHLHEDAADPEADIPEQGECGNLYLVSETFDEFWRLISEHLQGKQYISRGAK